MAFVKVVCCVIAFVLGLAIMQGFDFLVDLIKHKKGDQHDSENK